MRAGAGGLNFQGQARVSDEGRTTGSAGAPRQSRTCLISLGTNPTESTTSLRDEVSATDRGCVAFVVSIFRIKIRACSEATRVYIGLRCENEFPVGPKLLDLILRLGDSKLINLQHRNYEDIMPDHTSLTSRDL